MVNSAVKCCRAYTHLTHENDDFGIASTNTELDHTEDNISTYQAYPTNFSSPSASHTSKVLIPKSIWNELGNKIKNLIIAHNKNVGCSSPCSPATLSPASHTPPIRTKPVINHQVKVHEVKELSETPCAETPAEDYHQDPYLPCS